jgi:hypothetical protein
MTYVQVPPCDFNRGIRLTGQHPRDPMVAANGVRARRLPFLDYERAVSAIPDVLRRAIATISSVELGVRIAYRKTSLNLRLDCGFRLKTGAPGVRDHGRADFSLARALF